MIRFTESTVEDASLAWLETAGWKIAHGPDIAPDMPAAERRDYGEVVLAQRLRDALSHASFIGFTGTPIELQDANTRAAKCSAFRRTKSPFMTLSRPTTAP